MTRTITVTRSRCRCRPPMGSVRPGTTSSWRCADRPSPCSTPCSGSAGRTRTPSTCATRSLGYATCSAALTWSPTRSRSSPPSRRWPGTPWSRSCGPIRRYGRATPSRRTASGRWPRVHQGPATRAAPGLPRGPVHVVPPYRPGAGGRPAPQPPAAPRRGGAAPLRRGRPLGAPAQPGGQAAGDAGVPHGGTGPGARVRPGEPRGKPRLRAREGRGHGRHVGVRR